MGSNKRPQEKMSLDVLLGFSKRKQKTFRSIAAEYRYSGQGERKFKLMLHELSSDKELCVRKSVADNELSYKHTLDQLAKSEESCLRIIVAGNPNTSSKTLLFLSSDQNKNVRFTVARNNSSPSKALENCFNALDCLKKYDPICSEMKIALFFNPNTPDEIKRKIKEDNDERIKSAIRRGIIR